MDWTLLYAVLGLCGLIAAVMFIHDLCKKSFKYHDWTHAVQCGQNAVRRVDQAQVNELLSLGLDRLARDYNTPSILWELLVRRYFPRRRKH